MKKLAIALRDNDPEIFAGYVADLGTDDLAKIGEAFALCDPEFAKELRAY